MCVSAFVPFGEWWLVDLHVHCRGLPVHRASIQVQLSMYVRVDVSPDTPLCRASQMYKIWPPAWTGFHVSYSVFITGPPALSGFPFSHIQASGIDRLPLQFRSLQWASRIVGLPSCLHYGLPHGRASMDLTMYLSSGGGGFGG